MDKNKEIEYFRKYRSKKFKNQLKIDKLDSEISELKIKKYELDLQIKDMIEKRNELCQKG